MKGRQSSHKELTDPKNERLLGTLTPRGWAKLSVLAIRTQYYSQDLSKFDKNKSPFNPAEDLVHEARQSSGSIKGDHRRDLVEAIRGSKDPKQPLGLDDGDEEPGL